MSAVYRYRPYNKKLIHRAIEMRQQPTPAEQKLWRQVLRHLPFRFLRQRVIGHYIADFYCAELKLIIEVDGAHHFSEEGQAYDSIRTAFFQSMGVKVLRLTNHAVLNDISMVKQSIFQHIHQQKVPLR